MQDIEDIFKHIIFKMANVSKVFEGYPRYIDINEIILEIKLKISQGKK
jgi:hypothetical protein